MSLSTLSYRSRALAPMSESALRELQRVSQARNRVEQLTGLMLYDDGRFFQWLEGPTEALARVWDSVRRDVRHTDIEGLKILPAQTRVFGGSDMELATRTHDAQAALPSVAELSISPSAALPLLTALVSAKALTRSSPGIARVPSASKGSAAALLPVLETVLIPRLLAKRAAVRAFVPAVDPAAAELARLLIAADPGAASNLVRQLYAKAGSLAPLCATVFEPAARSLGDLWDADDCSQFEVTLALGRLQTSVHDLTAAARPVAWGLPVVLVAPQPGEVHLLGASLDANLLWQAGWDAHSEFPATDDALDAMLAGTWFDALDLSLSVAMRREDSMARMAQTIVSARRASLNPALVVVVGGRSFFEQDRESPDVGADANNRTSLRIDASITNAMRRARVNPKRPAR